MMARLALLCTSLCLSVVPVASGQVYTGRDAPRRGSVEVSGGGAWSGGFDLGERQAELTRSTGADRLDLFTSATDVGGVSGGQARVGVYMSPSISIEGGLRFLRPTLSIRLSRDVESAADAVATERVAQYAFDGSLLFHVRNASFARGRGVPFVSAGAGYLRELHEGNALLQTGREYHVTAGVKYWFGRGSRRLGLRGEVGLSAREKGVDYDRPRRVVPVASGGLGFLF